jgi:hypothetical protein
MSRTLDGVLPVLKERRDIENHEEVVTNEAPDNKLAIG